MTEEEAKSWVGAHFGDDAITTMQRIVDAVLSENAEQNLIAPSTRETIWARHIVDSAQLLCLAGSMRTEDLWIDIGSGAGFPGLVVAALTTSKFLLVEPRKRRAQFLTDVVRRLDIPARVTVQCGQIQEVRGNATVISARAVAPIDRIFAWSTRCSDVETRWILPKGRSANVEVESLSEKWHGVFHVERSITDRESLIVLASGVARR